MSLANKSLYLLLIAGLACNSDKKEKQKKAEAIVNNHLVNINRIITHKESEEIDEYISRHGWEMQRTGTGLRYSIYNKQKNGIHPANGSVVRIRQSIFLLDGTECYASQKKNIQTYRIGQGELSNGMEEALKLMKPGEKAKLIIPSHLAYGLTGDNNEIPTHSVLVCDVELINTN